MNIANILAMFFFEVTWYLSNINTFFWDDWISRSYFWKAYKTFFCGISFCTFYVYYLT